jgi:hypothetical protein
VVEGHGDDGVTTLVRITFVFTIFDKGRHDIQQNGIELNKVQPNGIQ